MSRRQFLTLVATILGSGIVILDGVVVNLALPSISKDLHASFADLQWIIDAYLLSLSALILIGGSLGDIFGRKKVYLFGLVGFGISSLLCGLSPSVEALIGLRVLQGVFGALLVPGALAIINTNFGEEKRAAAFGHWTAWISIITAIGPLIGGYILDIGSWRWVFFINIPLIVACYLLAQRNIKETKDERTRSVDLVGASLAALALACITYGLIEGPVKHWNTATILTIIAGFATGIIFIITEKRSKDPMLELKLFKNRNFSGVNITTFAMYGGLSGFIFSLLIYLQSHLGYSTIKAGLSLLPISIIMLLLAGRMGKLAVRHGSRLFMTIGPIVSGLGLLTLLSLNPGDSYIYSVFPGILLFSLGLATTVAPLTVTVMASVPSNESGIASGINNAVSRVAGLIVIALLGVLGAEQAFRFSIALSGGMLIAAGLISWALIRNVKSVNNPSLPS